MQLNWLGRLQMNNPARAAAQRRITARHMRRLGGTLDGGIALEIGCGRGVGAEIILVEFGAGRVHAFDVDPLLVTRAKKRLAGHRDAVGVSIASATEIPAPDESFDAVFDFGVIHQIATWRKAVAECARVLKPGGRMYFEAVAGRVYRLPMNLAMKSGTPDVRRIGFDRDSYLAELEANGVHVGTNYVQPRLPITAALVGDLIGVGLKHDGR